MRYLDERRIVTLGIFTLAAAVALLFRLRQKVHRRVAQRDEAFEKLRESGEYFLG